MGRTVVRGQRPAADLRRKPAASCRRYAHFVGLFTVRAGAATAARDTARESVLERASHGFGPAPFRASALEGPGARARAARRAAAGANTSCRPALAGQLFRRRV